MVSVIRSLGKYLHSVPGEQGGIQQKANESSRPVTPILVRQASSSNVPPLIKVIEHAGHQAVVMQNGINGRLSLNSGLPVLVFAELAPSKTQELEVLQALHQQIPDAKIIALVDHEEPDEQAVRKCAEQPGVFRAFKDPFNAGELLDIVGRLLPAEPR